MYFSVSFEHRGRHGWTNCRVPPWQDGTQDHFDDGVFAVCCWLGVASDLQDGCSAVHWTHSDWYRSWYGIVDHSGKYRSTGAVFHKKLRCVLKGRYKFMNCQRPVFSLGVSHHKHKITSLWKFVLNRSSKLRENDERKNTLVGRIFVLSDRNKRLLARSLLLF